MARPKVLIVEDDPLLLMVAADSLRDAGLVVLEAMTADAALTLLQDCSHEVAVVLSDVETPGALNGAALASVVKHVWPTIHVVLTSGHAVPSEKALPEGVRFIAKPYSVPGMSRLIADLAEAPPAS